MRMDLEGEVREVIRDANDNVWLRIRLCKRDDGVYPQGDGGFYRECAINEANKAAAYNKKLEKLHLGWITIEQAGDEKPPAKEAAKGE